MTLSQLASLSPPKLRFDHPEFRELIDAIRLARTRGRPVILMLGAHPIKLGLGRFITDLMKRKLISHIATNGAGIIHDFELALWGGTSENVAKWISVGQFGLWRETGDLNEIVREAAKRHEGIGEAVGRTLVENACPNVAQSICATGWTERIPVTSHITIGGDIIHSLPNADGGALGQTSYTDFLIFVESIRCLEGGVYLNVGTAVTGPEVFLKALSMCRNVARRNGNRIQSFTTAVFDLVPIPDNFRDGHPEKEDALYYYRPWKTLLCRTISGEGRSFYFCGDHRTMIPTLWHDLVRSMPYVGTAAASGS